MATWKELSLDSYEAAKLLCHAEKWRSSVSRSYYSAYSAVAGELEGKVTYPHGMRNPPHETLPVLIRSGLTSLTVPQRRRLATIVSRLYSNRIDADYRPSRTVDKVVAVFSLSDAADVLKLLSII